MMKLYLSFLFSCFYIVTSAQLPDSKFRRSLNIESETHALVIGVSKMADQSFPVAEFSGQDATLFANYLSSEEGGQLAAKNISLLIGENATLANISAGLDDLITETNSGDVVYIYYSGFYEKDHNSYDDSHYFICYDSHVNSFFNTALKKDVFEEVVNILSLQGVEVILVADTGKAQDLVFTEADVISLFACRGNEFSIEGKQWGGGHGVFTYYLVKGLWGAADRDHDLSISLYEIERYLIESIKEHEPEMGGIQQTPMAIGSPSTTVSLVKAKTDYFSDELFNEDQVYREITDHDSNDNVSNTKVPQYKMMNTMNSRGQALLSEVDSFEIELELTDTIDYLLVNEEKTLDPSVGMFRAKVGLSPGLNEIYISAVNKKVRKSDTLLVYTSYNFSRRYLKNEVNYYGLFIAVDEYDDNNFQKLANPIYDAKSVSEELAGNYDFEIDTLMNPTKTEILTKLIELSDRFKSSSSKKNNDHLLIFFSGHGVFDDRFKQGHFAPRDSKYDDPTYESYLSYADLQNKIDNLHFEHILVVMDACFGGTFDLGLASNIERSGSNKYSPVSTNKFIKEKLRYKTRRLIASGRDVPVYDGNINQNSPFVKRFLEALRSDDNQILTLQKLQQYLDKSNPVPHSSVFGTNEPGSNFLLQRIK